MASVAHGVHSISDRFVDELVALDPITATFQGITGYDDRLTDFSIEGHQARAEVARAALRDMAAAEPADDAERTAKAVFLERVELDVELHDAGLTAAALNVIECPVQVVRQAFDLMPNQTAEQWAVIATRLAAVPDALAGYRTALLHSSERGIISAQRQVRRTAEQCETWAGSNGSGSFFARFVAGADEVPGVDAALRAELDAAATVAAEAYGELAGF